MSDKMADVQNLLENLSLKKLDCLQRLLEKLEDALTCMEQNQYDKIAALMDDQRELRNAIDRLDAEFHSIQSRTRCEIDRGHCENSDKLYDILNHQKILLQKISSANSKLTDEVKAASSSAKENLMRIKKQKRLNNIYRGQRQSHTGSIIDYRDK